MRNLTVEEVIDINKSLSKFGVVFGMINPGNLEFVVEESAHSVEIFNKAAVLLRGIAVGHPFIDGNKRTAFESASMLLKLNDVKLDVCEEEGERFMLLLVSEKGLTLKETEIWVRRHVD